MFHHALSVIWLIICLPSSQGVPFCTDTSSVWTKSYISAPTKVGSGNGVSPTLFVASSASVPISSWLSDVSQKEEHILQPGQRTEIVINSKNLQPMGSSLNRKRFGLITTQNTATFLRDSATFYQLREVNQIQFKYRVISFTSAVRNHYSVIMILASFDVSKLTITFKDGINVTALLSNVINHRYVTVSGNTVVIKPIGHLNTVKLQSKEDLTGTSIVCTKQCSVISGAMSLNPAIQYVYLDSLMPDNEAGMSYVVFGIPGTGTDVCRIVAIKAGTSIVIGGTPSVMLTNAGDFYDATISRGSFMLLTSSSGVTVALFISGAGPRFSDMIVFQELSDKNPTEYTFAIPSFQTDVNFSHYIIITTTSTGHDIMKLNGQPLPASTVWTPVLLETEYIGGYIPLNESSLTQTIQSGTPFNAYLVGIGDDAMYGSALISNKSPETYTDYLKFTLNKTFCERTNKVGNYDSNGTSMEVVDVTAVPGKRRVSYVIKHLKTSHLQACQMMCFQYSNCTGINYTDSPTEDVNCDIVIRGPVNMVSTDQWTFYRL